MQKVFDRRSNIERKCKNVDRGQSRKYTYIFFIGSETLDKLVEKPYAVWTSETGAKKRIFEFTGNEVHKSLVGHHTIFHRPLFPEERRFDCIAFGQCNAWALAHTHNEAHLRLMPLRCVLLWNFQLIKLLICTKWTSTSTNEWKWKTRIR